ncbi:MAG: PAC2 family protein [Halobacteriales archaeon]|nr:PAC2 family protein [Halobacteriales archaeon]
MATEPSFEITAPSDRRPGSTLVVGLSTPGLAGLTAADYLVRHLDAEEIGAVIPDGLPAIAPFEAGVPRHPTRLFDLVGRSLSVLVGELYVPPPVAHPFVDGLRDWAHSVGVEEVALLHGVPYPHDEAEHAVYHVATPGYRERHFADEAVPPLGGGVLDGVAGELVGRALEDDALEVGVYVTPTHPPGPDVEAALRLIDALEGRYGFEIDPAELEALAERLGRYHAELADRMEALAQAEAPIGSREFPEDRMYM